MKKALLVIGDKYIKGKRPERSFAKFVRYARKLKGEKKLELAVINYSQLLSKKIPPIKSPRILVVFFFPYKYWNRNIEIYPDERIYGDKKFGREFKSFFRKIEKTIAKYYKGRQIEYLNSPGAICLDRDKKASKALLEKNAILSPRTFKVFSFIDIQRMLNKGMGLYIKPRFGALGKGITYIDKEGVISNFAFRRGKILSRPYDCDWRFGRVKDKRRFIHELLKRGFLCEEAITPATFEARRFDFRVYVMFGRVVYMYAKSSPADVWVTNWSQGGRIDKKGIILRGLAKGKKAQLKKLAKKTARALGLDFAGIDIIFSEGLKTAYVLEGNAFPGYEKGFDLMKSLLKFVADSG
ncbi:MAG: hypothetical protein JSV30_03900 [Candidatus Omnitrophota bacterium]|nr:MAG: hypothetical protein JSV30_03900 [Candidatus Omnitrophota bacterium]